jgi:hypothetical protein
MADTDTDPGWQFPGPAGQMIIPYPETAAAVVGNMVQYVRLKSEIKQPDLSDISKTQCKKTGSHQLAFDDAASLLERYNIPVVPWILTGDVEKAGKFMNRENSVAVKSGNPEVIHKSDLGLVQLNISSAGGLQKAMQDISQRFPITDKDESGKKFLLQKMVPRGVEMILGASCDPLFGKIIMFGIGGITVELYQDVIFRISPLSRKDASDMLEGVQSQEYLNGFRGLPKVNRKIMTDLIYSFALMIQENPQIIEMDINPLIWPQGYQKPVVADCRVTVSD